MVTPRDVIELLTKAKQKQQDILSANPDGESEHLFESQSLIYGLAELSKRKRITYLEAEFPHLWPHIKALVGGKTNHSEHSLEKILGSGWGPIADDLVSIGVLKKSLKDGVKTFSFPYLYITGLELIRGTEED